MTTEDFDFATTYSAMEDEELLEVARDACGLAPAAKVALDREMSKRGLDTDVARQEEQAAESSEANRDERLAPLAILATTPEAEMIRELLSQNGISCVLQGGNFGALEPLPRRGGFSEIRLLVRQTELSRAQELYEAFFVSTEAALQEDEDTSSIAQQDEQ